MCWPSPQNWDSNQVTIAPIFVPLYVLATVLSITCAYCCTSHGINPVTIVPKSNYPDSGCLDILPHCTCPIISVQFSYGVPWRQTNLLTSFSSKVWPKGGWGAADSKVGGQVNNLGGQEYYYYHYYCCYSNLNKSELPRGQSSLPCVGILIMPEHPWLTNLVSAQYSAQTKVTPGTKYFLHTKIPFSRIVILTRCLGQSKMPVWLVSFKFKRRRCWQGWPPAMIFYWRQ